MHYTIKSNKILPCYGNFQVLIIIIIYSYYLIWHGNQLKLYCHDHRFTRVLVFYFYSIYDDCLKLKLNKKSSSKFFFFYVPCRWISNLTIMLLCRKTSLLFVVDVLLPNTQNCHHPMFNFNNNFFISITIIFALGILPIGGSS